MDMHDMLKISLNRGVIISITLSVVAAFIVPGVVPGISASPLIETGLVFVGVLFGIIVGFFINDRYARFQAIKENAAIDAGGLTSYWHMSRVVADETGDDAWLEKQRKYIESYVREFMPLSWRDYGQTQKHFTGIMESLKDLDYDTDKANETYTNMLVALNQVSSARENLMINGQDHLTRTEWTVLLLLGGILEFSLFYIKTNSPLSIMFTAIISSSILILLLVIRDYDDLKRGKTYVSVEPYQRVLDALDRPRYVFK